MTLRPRQTLAWRNPQRLRDQHTGTTVWTSCCVRGLTRAGSQGRQFRLIRLSLPRAAQVVLFWNTNIKCFLLLLFLLLMYYYITCCFNWSLCVPRIIFLLLWKLECSCSLDCGLDLNCCHSHLDKYRIVETEQLSCIAPYFDKKRRRQRSGYYMVDTCPVGTLYFTRAPVISGGSFPFGKSGDSPFYFPDREKTVKIFPVWEIKWSIFICLSILPGG